jgi:hypothetical protein
MKALREQRHADLGGCCWRGGRRSVRMFGADEGIATGIPGLAISRWGLSAGAA